MNYSWVVFALFSALCGTCRQLYIKMFCQQIPPEILILCTRLWGTVLLFPLFMKYGVHISCPTHFFAVVIVSSLLTAIATSIRISVIQTEEISLAMPFLAFVPLLMWPWNILLLKEYPRQRAMWGIVLMCFGAYSIYISPRARWYQPFLLIVQNRATRFMLIVSTIFGITTVGDKIAILASDSFSYMFVWTVVSSVVMMAILLRHKADTVIRFAVNKHNIMQTLLWIGGFFSQMFSIELAKGVDGSAMYVKALIMLQIVFTVIIGGRLFHEQKLFQKAAASLLMMCGSLLLIRNSSH